MSRAVLVQLSMFVLIALVCAGFVFNTVLGPQAVRAPIRVAVHLPDAAGLAPTSQVTYRGVRTGTVGDVRIDQGGEGVTVDLLLDPGSRVPADSIARISMDTPMAVQHLDLQPATDGPPYLSDGGEIRAERTSAPMPLETLLVHTMRLADSIDPHDVQVLSEAAATGLNGTAPQLQRILDGTRDLTQLAAQQEPKITNLIEQGPEALGPAEDLPELAASMRDLADQARAQDPQIRHLLETAPGTTTEVTKLLAQNQQAGAQLLGNLLGTSQVLNGHIPALKETMTALPQGLGDLGSIVHGDVADFYLVAAQGPVCYYGTERRMPTETEPREPHLGWSCPSGPGLQQRGADSAPRPNSVTSSSIPPASAPADSPTPDTAPAGAAQQQVMGPRPWSSMFTQGVR